MYRMHDRVILCFPLQCWLKKQTAITIAIKHMVYHLQRMVDDGRPWSIMFDHGRPWSSMELFVMVQNKVRHKQPGEADASEHSSSSEAGEMATQMKKFTENLKCVNKIFEGIIGQEAGASEFEFL